MALKLLSHDQIDQQKWDKAILKHQLPLVFAQSFYLNATCKNWKALVLDDYKAVMPITEGKKLNIKYLFQPPFTPQLGVFGTNDEKVTDQFLTTAKELYKFIEIELNASNLSSEKELKEKNTFVVDLSKEVKFNENTKRNISKAKKSNITVKVISDYNATRKLTNTYLAPWLIKEIGISAKHGDVFKNLVKSCFDANKLLVLAAYSESNELLSFGYFVSNGSHAVYLKGMSLHKKDNSGSMHLLMAAALNHYRSKAQWFDFGGGNSQGMANFYKGLGGQVQTYHLLKVNNLAWPLNKLKK
jgi:hypothetical protein